MAKIVIAGSANCPHYARIELLADQLHHTLPSFHLHKIVKQPSDWTKWLKDECSKNGWKHEKSPIVWRELVDRGGKGVLIGGANEFQEYVNCYYSLKSSLMSTAMQNVAQDNTRFKHADDSEERHLRSLSSPIRVCITNASSNCAYNLIPRIADGEVFGPDVELSLILYDSNEDVMQRLKGVQMEVFDMSTRLVRQITVTNDFEKAAENCAVVIILDELDQGEEESREDWLRRNAEHYTDIACILDRQCKQETKVLLCGSGPLNFCAYMMLQSVNNLHRFNIVAVPRSFERQVKAVLATKMNVNSAGVTDVVVWGNPSGKCYIDLSRCRVFGFDGAIVGPPSFSRPTEDTLWDKKWLRTELMPLSLERHKKIAEMKGPAMPSNAMARAYSIADFLKHWWNGSPGKEIYSLSVCSTGLYGIPEGLVYSFPVIFHPRGYWSVVEDIELSEDAYTQLNECVKDLISEKEVIFPTAPEETTTTDMFGSSFAPTALETAAKEEKTPIEKLEERIGLRYPEQATLLKSKLLEAATADELVKWVDDSELFMEKVRSVLKEEEEEEERAPSEHKVQHPSSDEMMTAIDSEGVQITDDETAAAAAVAAAKEEEKEEDDAAKEEE